MQAKDRFDDVASRLRVPSVFLPNVIPQKAKRETVDKVAGVEITSLVQDEGPVMLGRGEVEDPVPAAWITRGPPLDGTVMGQAFPDVVTQVTHPLFHEFANAVTCRGSHGQQNVPQLCNRLANLYLSLSRWHNAVVVALPTAMEVVCLRVRCFPL